MIHGIIIITTGLTIPITMVLTTATVMVDTMALAETTLTVADAEIWFTDAEAVPLWQVQALPQPQELQVLSQPPVLHAGLTALQQL